MPETSPDYDRISAEPKYKCRVCDADLTKAVQAARQSTFDTFRYVVSTSADKTPKPWRVRVACPDGHENMFEG